MKDSPYPQQQQSRQARFDIAVDFFFRPVRGGARSRWSDGVVECSRWINPYDRMVGWTLADVHAAFDRAAAIIIVECAEGRLRGGIRPQYARVVIRETALEYARRHGRRP